MWTRLSFTNGCSRVCRLQSYSSPLGAARFHTLDLRITPPSSENRCLSKPAFPEAFLLPFMFSVKRLTEGESEFDPVYFSRLARVNYIRTVICHEPTQRGVAAAAAAAASVLRIPFHPVA